MNNPNALQVAQSSLSTAESYFCFIRSWWEGVAVDAVAWWGESSGCFQRIIVTGEAMEPRAPRSDKVVPIEQDQLKKVLWDFEQLGFLSLPHQLRRVRYTHYDHWHGLKLGAADLVHWLRVVGGRHADPREHAILETVFRFAPELRRTIELE